MTEGMTDVRALLLRAAGGDQEAFGRVCIEVLPKLRAHTRRLCSSKNLPIDYAQDIAQETVLKLAESAPSEFESWDALVGWLFRVATNVANDMLRRQRAKKRGGGAKPSQVDVNSLAAPNNSQSAAELSCHHDALMAALKLLPKADRVILEGFLAGETFAQLAIQLGLHQGTLRRRYKRALDSLRQQLIA